MPVLVIIFVISFVFYIFYKIKFFSCQRPAEKKWISSKSSIALGLFVAFFGINQFFMNTTTIAYIVGAIFTLLGAFSVWGGVKRYKALLPAAIEEAEQLKRKA